MFYEDPLSKLEKLLSSIEARLSAIECRQESIINALIQMEIMEMATLDDDLALATQQTTLEASVKQGFDTLTASNAALQTQLAAALAAPQQDQAKIDQINTALVANNAALSAIVAVASNTPAAATAPAVPAS